MRAGHEIAGEASNHSSGQLNHLGALDAGTADAGPERTLWYRRRTANADDQFDAAVNDQNLAVASRRLAQLARQRAFVEGLTIAGLLRVATTMKTRSDHVHIHPRAHRQLL